MSRITKALNGSKDVPIELVEYRLCKEFGWTPTELDKQPKQSIDRFIRIMSIENQLREADEKRAA